MGAIGVSINRQKAHPRGAWMGMGLSIQRSTVPMTAAVQVIVARHIVVVTAVTL